MRDVRISIAAILLVLISIGIVMIYSSSGIYALQELGNSTYYLHRHLSFLLLGFLLMLGVMTVDYYELRKISKPLLLFAIFLLILVLIPGIGKEANGARRWFQIGALSFQPSEMAKVILIIYVADFLARKQNKIRSFKEGFLPLILVLGVVCLLILKQPDLGNCVLLGVLVFILMFVAGARLRHLASLILLSLPVIYFLIIRVPYRMARIMAFLDPWEDSLGVGFQLSQSQIALGSGGLYGVGLGKSVQKLFYLPAAHTDFILSIIGEELGFIGTLTVVLLFIFFLWQGLRIVRRTTDEFGYFLSMGLLLLMGLQVVVNVGVSIGALPTKGLPLPFISYGGSALIFNLMAVGLLLNVSRHQDL